MRGMREVIDQVRWQLTDIMHELGWTQADLGRMTGRAQPTISQILRGKNPDVKLSSIVALAAAMDHEIFIFVVPRAQTVTPITCDEDNLGTVVL